MYKILLVLQNVVDLLNLMLVLIFGLFLEHLLCLLETVFQEMIDVMIGKKAVMLLVLFLGE